jgi:predicted RNase H-like nuclease (RuvC/YqgF family)
MESKYFTATIDVDLSVDRNITTSEPKSPSKVQLENTTLKRDIDEKKREIERLNTVIECMSPVPGYDYDKVRRMVVKGDDTDMDHRDSKIVSLAKKSRNLTVQVNKLMAENDNLQQSIRDLNIICNQLRGEVALSRANGGVDTSPSISENTSKELAIANKSVEELRRKYIQVKEEAKNYRNALIREIGEGVTLEQALDGGNWRGRAQTIVMLKSKIRRLELQIQQGLKLMTCCMSICCRVVNLYVFRASFKMKVE